MRRSLALLLTFIAVACGATGRAAETPPAGHSAAMAVYARGIAAFRVGDFAAARSDFIHARELGIESSQLDYSLGAACYRLGRYGEAAIEFRKLLSDPHLAALAHYNLGLIALQRSDYEAARRQFQASYDGASEVTLKRLATAELARLPPPTALAWFGYVALGAGYDDDIAPSSTSALIPPSQAGSPLVSLLAGGAGQLSGIYANGLRLSGSFYHIGYPRFSQLDETFASVAPEYRYSSGSWTSALAVTGNDAILGGSAFEHSFGLRFGETWHVAGRHALAGGYEYEHVAGEGAYGYLTGRRQAVFAEYRFVSGALQAAAGYQHETNRRNDLTTSTEFFSASPTNDTVYGRLRLPLTDKLRGRLSASYEVSRYGSPDILQDGNTTLSITRDDDQYLVSVGMDYGFAPNWTLGFDIRYFDDASNIPLYSYRSRRLTLSLEYLSM